MPTGCSLPASSPNFQTSNTFSNLSAGNYTFFVKNEYGCIDSGYFPILSNCAIQASWDYSNSACTTDGHITFVWQAAGVDHKGNPVRRKGFVILVR